MKLLLVALFAVVSALCGAAKFTTEMFGGQYRIESDGTVHVQELISVTFTEPQRGLIRRLPMRTRSDKGDVREVQYTLETVTLDVGRGPNEVRVQEGYEQGNWTLKIGDPNRTFQGKAAYRIEYSIQGATTPFPTDPKLGPHSEFLWNLTPTDWPTQIGKSTFDILYPEPVAGRVVARIIVGPKGGRRGIQVAPDEKAIGDLDLVQASFKGNKLQVSRSKPLPQGHNLTLGLSLPGDTIRPPAPNITRETAASNRMPEPPAGYGFLGFAPLLAIPLAYALSKRLWPPPSKPLVVRFDPPPGIGPSLSGLVMDGNVDRHDIVAGIVSLAQKGGIRMHHPPEGVSGVVLELLGYERVRQPDPFESSLYRGLEPYGPIIQPDSLRGSFGPSYQALVADLHEESRTRGLLHDVSGTKSGMGCLMFLGIGLLTFFVLIFNPCVAIVSAFVAFGVGSALIGRISPLTASGHEAKWHLQGLREFISRAHEKELNYMSQRMPDQVLFETLLPYAVAFNLVQQWTRAFEGIDLQMPEWYAGSTFGPMDMLWTSMLVNDLITMDNDYGSSMAEGVSDYGSGGFFSGGESGFGGDWDSGGGFDGGFGGGDGGGGGGGDSW